MAISLGNLAVSGARAFAGYGRGQLAGEQLAQTEEDRQRRLNAEALRLSLSVRSDQRDVHPQQRADDAQRNLESERADLRSYRNALLRRRGREGLTPREEEGDAYAAARAIAEYQAGTNARAWKPETLGIYLHSRFPKLDQNRLLGLAMHALTSNGMSTLNLDEAAGRLPPEE